MELNCERGKAILRASFAKNQLSSDQNNFPTSFIVAYKDTLLSLLYL